MNLRDIAGERKKKKTTWLSYSSPCSGDRTIPSIIKFLTALKKIFYNRFLDHSMLHTFTHWFVLLVNISHSPRSSPFCIYSHYIWHSSCFVQISTLSECKQFITPHIFDTANTHFSKNYPLFIPAAAGHCWLGTSTGGVRTALKFTFSKHLICE